jgi:hypothetical protein
MQFDAASSSKYLQENTLHNYIFNKYSTTQYKPPKFIYWNLSSNHDTSFPVKSLSNNVAMISGFSEQLLKVFMNNDDFNPEKIVYEILEPYKVLKNSKDLHDKEIERRKEKAGSPKFPHHHFAVFGILRL